MLYIPWRHLVRASLDLEEMFLKNSERIQSEILQLHRLEVPEEFEAVLEAIFNTHKEDDIQVIDRVTPLKQSVNLKSRKVIQNIASYY